MLELLRRLQEIAARLDRPPPPGFDVKDIPVMRHAIDEERDRKEAELNELESELDDLEALAASFQGGPDQAGPDADADGDNGSDPSGDNQE